VPGPPWTLDIRVSRRAVILGQLCNVGAGIFDICGTCAFLTRLSLTALTFGQFSGIGGNVLEDPAPCTFDMRLSWSAAIFEQLCKVGGSCVGRRTPAEYRDSRSFARSRTRDKGMAGASDGSVSDAESSPAAFSELSESTVAALLHISSLALPSTLLFSNDSATSASDASDTDPEWSSILYRTTHTHTHIYTHNQFYRVFPTTEQFLHGENFRISAGLGPQIGRIELPEYWPFRQTQLK